MESSQHPGGAHGPAVARIRHGRYNRAGGVGRALRAIPRAAVELVLASHQARDPDLVPWRALEDFPPGTEARAWEQVREAADAIISSFEGSAPRFTFGYLGRGERK